MEDGYLIRVDEEYLRESIQNPSAQTVKGYITGSMHSDFQFNEEELSAIIAYIKTL
tara:strand:- start:274 stop:441 length:168 start_codon:yes stop_codon:yes gene_type:complete